VWEQEKIAAELKKAVFRGEKCRMPSKREDICLSFCGFFLSSSFKGSKTLRRKVLQYLNAILSKTLFLLLLLLFILQMWQKWSLSVTRTQFYTLSQGMKSIECHLVFSMSHSFSHQGLFCLPTFPLKTKNLFFSDKKMRNRTNNVLKTRWKLKAARNVF